MESPAAGDSFRSSSSSSTFFSEDSFHVGYYPPMSEYEEIPSLRWLPENFLSSKPSNPPPPPPGRAAAAAVTTSELESSYSAYPELDLFHTHVADMLYTVVGEDRRPPVSLSILRRLLEAFVCIEGEFKAALRSRRGRWRQVEAMWASFPPPRGADATALAMAVYAMSAVVVLVLWILVLAFPCQGHDPSAVATGMARPLAPPWKAPWAAPMVALQERIAEEWRRAPSPGLLGELQSLARCGRAVVEVAGGATGINPLEEEEQWEEQWEDVGRELAATCRDMEEHLEPLQQQVREVFQQLLSRATVLGGVRSDGPEASFNRAAKNIGYLNPISDNMKKRIRIRKLLIPNPIISNNSYRIRIRKHLFPTPTPTHLHP